MKRALTQIVETIIAVREIITRRILLSSVSNLMSCCRKRSGHSRIDLTRRCDGSRDSIVVLDGFLNDACIVVVESVGDIIADEIWRNMASSI